jgi:hypothetical protein
MSRITLFRSGASLRSALLVGSALLSSVVLVACGEQKDPNDGLGGGDETSDETSTTKPTGTSTPDETAGDTSEPTPTEGPSDSTGEPASSADTSEPDGTTGGGDTSEPAPSSTGAEDTSAPPANNGICPMADGATWTYWHTSKGGWSEAQTVTTGEYDGEPVFVVSDTPDPDPASSLRADSYIALKGGKLLRLYKEEFWVDPTDPDNEVLNATATYGVGFTRCNEAWANAEVGWSESPEYERVETPSGQAAKAPETRKHTFTVEGREDVTATKGGPSFTDCVKVRRSKDWAAVDGEDADEKLYWFCPGVGKVREENVVSGNFEELTEYDIPE